MRREVLHAPTHRSVRMTRSKRKSRLTRARRGVGGRAREGKELRRGNSRWLFLCAFLAPGMHSAARVPRLRTACQCARSTGCCSRLCSADSASRSQPRLRRSLGGARLSLVPSSLVLPSSFVSMARFRTLFVWVILPILLASGYALHFHTTPAFDVATLSRVATEARIRYPTDGSVDSLERAVGFISSELARLYPRHIHPQGARWITNLAGGFKTSMLILHASMTEVSRTNTHTHTRKNSEHDASYDRATYDRVAGDSSPVIGSDCLFFRSVISLHVVVLDVCSHGCVVIFST